MAAVFDNKATIEYMAVSMPINEDFYEQVIIEHLRDDLGYDYLYGPDVPGTTTASCSFPSCFRTASNVSTRAFLTSPSSGCCESTSTRPRKPRRLLQRS